MRNFFAFQKPAGPPAHEKVVSVVILTILLGFVLAAFGNPKELQATLEGPPQAAETNRYTGYDKDIQKFTNGTYAESANNAASGPPGNFIMIFRNFDTANPQVQGQVQWFYYRAAYAAYPLRVYVADADTVIPHQPLYTPPIPDFHPTREWAVAHDIKRVVTIAPQADGRIGYAPQELSLSSKP